MKKKIVAIALSIIILIAGAGTAAMLIFGYTPSGLLARLYCGDRIIVNIHTTVDGENAEAKLNQPTMQEQEFYQCANNIARINNNTLRSKTFGYGDHNFYLIIDDKYPIVLQMYQWNWWDIQHCDLYIDIDTKNNTITYCDSYTNLDEKGKRQHGTNEKITEHKIDTQTYIWAGAE